MYVIQPEQNINGTGKNSTATTEDKHGVVN